MGSDFALSSMISNPVANTVSANQNKEMEEIIMKKLLSCEFNIDTACVELKYSDGSMLAIDCDAVEDEYAKTIRQRSALDYLVYNAPLEYVELVLRGGYGGVFKGSAMTSTLDVSIRSKYIWACSIVGRSLDDCINIW